MYDKGFAAAGSAGGAGALAFTCVDLLWLLLAGFALLAVGMAVLRIVPRSRA